MTEVMTTAYGCIAKGCRVNLKDGNGRVPIPAEGETPWLLVDWPTRETFDEMFRRHSAELREKYRRILNARKGGQLLKEAGAPFGLSRERVRQIEAKFQSRVKIWHESKRA